MENKENKKAALLATLKNIEKKFGKGTIMDMSGPVNRVASIPTGSLKLDEALGIGGLPEGRVIEIYGPESSGKTTLTLHVLAEAQKKGKTVAFVDAEHALDVSYARNLGVKVEEMIVSQPDYGEQALDIVEELVRSGAVDVIIVDSVAALTPKAEIEGEMEDHSMGVQARMMSKGLRKITSIANKNKVTLIFINQIRLKIGVMFGNPETTTGGNALKFFASVRLDVRRTGTTKDKNGNETKVKVVKNKVAPPFKEANFVIEFGKGIDKRSEIVDLAEQFGFINKGGAWYNFNELKFNGKDRVLDYLKENPDVESDFEEKVRKAMSEVHEKSGFVETPPDEAEFNEDEIDE